MAAATLPRWPAAVRLKNAAADGAPAAALGGKGGDKKEGLLAFHIKDHTLYTHTHTVA